MMLSNLTLGELATLVGSSGVTVYIMYMLYVFIGNHFEHVKNVEVKIDSIVPAVTSLKDQIILKMDTKMDQVITKVDNKMDTFKAEINGNLTTVNGTVQNLAVQLQVSLDRDNQQQVDDMPSPTPKPRRRR